MTFTISVDALGDTCVASAAGTARLPELSSAVTMLAHYVDSHGHRRVLADLSATQPCLSFTEYLRLGGQLSGSLARLARLAVVVPPGYLDTPAEKAARLTGLCIRTFVDASRARQWLDQPGDGRVPCARSSTGMAAAWSACDDVPGCPGGA